MLAGGMPATTVTQREFFVTVAQAAVGDFYDGNTTAKKAAKAITELAQHIYSTDQKPWDEVVGEVLFAINDVIPSHMVAPDICPRCGAKDPLGVSASPDRCKGGNRRCKGGDPGWDLFYAKIAPLLPDPSKPAALR